MSMMMQTSRPLQVPLQNQDLRIRITNHFLILVSENFEFNGIKEEQVNCEETACTKRVKHERKGKGTSTAGNFQEKTFLWFSCFLFSRLKASSTSRGFLFRCLSSTPDSIAFWLQDWVKSWCPKLKSGNILPVSFRQLPSIFLFPRLSCIRPDLEFSGEIFQTEDSTEQPSSESATMYRGMYEFAPNLEKILLSKTRKEMRHEERVKK